MRHSNSVQSRQQAFKAQAFLDSAGLSRKIVEFKRSNSYIRRAIPLTMLCMFKKVV
jgi:hypothetical protein